MRRKAHWPGLVVALALCGAVPAVAQGSGAHVTVGPSAGGPGTSFVVRFTAPERSGHIGSMNREYVISVDGPGGSAKCVHSASQTAPRSGAHARVRVSLTPKSFGGRWCVGTFHGTVEELETPVCPPRELCPAFIVLVRRLGHFRFRVRTAAGARDTTPAPLRRTGLGLRVHSGRAAARARRPRSRSPGNPRPTTSRRARESCTTCSSRARPEASVFSHPSWTTAPGVTRFRTPGLASHGSFYFVVRARDQAGNEDRNRVERRGIDPCL